MTEKTPNILVSERIPRLLIKTSAPIIFALIVNGLYNVVDAIFLGHKVGPLALSALAIVFPVQLFLLAVGMTVSNGMASVMARSLGAGIMDKAGGTLGNALLTVTVLALGFTIFGIVQSEPLLLGLGATETILPYARDYLEISLLATVFFMATIVFNDAFRSEGKPQLLMGSLLVGTLLNIILDVVFIFGLEMGIKGAAYATLLAQIAAFAYCCFFYVTGRTAVSLSLARFSPDFGAIKEMVLLGSPIFLNQIGVSISIGLMNNLINGRYADGASDIYIGAFSIIIKVLFFVIYPLHGMAIAFQTICGFNYGAKRTDRVREAIKVTLRTTVIYGFAILALCLFLPGAIAFMFTSDRQVIDAYVSVSPIFFCFFPLLSIFFVGNSLFLAIGKIKVNFLLSISRVYYFLLPGLLLLSQFSFRDAVWYAFPVADVLAGLLVGFWLFRQYRSMA